MIAFQSLVLFVVLGCSLHHVNSQESAYQLPDGADLILTAPLTTSFTCEGQAYGYYADVANNCEVFHVCLPIEDEIGTIVETAQYSFMCGNQTVFDQSTLTCNSFDVAFPCADSPSLYGSVEFGVIPPAL